MLLPPLWLSARPACRRKSMLPATLLRLLIRIDRFGIETLLVEGLKLLELSAGGSELTEYHLEAAIASVHSTAARTEETDWETIVSLYDTLMATHPSPIVALNRAIAIAQKDGPERGLEEIAAIEDRDRLTAYPFYWAAL